MGFVNTLITIIIKTLRWATRDCISNILCVVQTVLENLSHFACCLDRCKKSLTFCVFRQLQKICHILHVVQTDAGGPASDLPVQPASF